MSPYIAREAEKLGIGKSKPFDSKHYAFSRQITDGVKIQPSAPPIESWFSGIVACICMVALVIAVWVVLANVAQEFVR